MFYGLTSAAGKSLVDSLKDLWNSTGFVANDFAYYENYHFGIWGLLFMVAVGCLLIYLAVVKKYEPTLLLGIAFGVVLINLPGAYNILYGTYGYTFTDASGAVVASGTLENLCQVYGVTVSGKESEIVAALKTAIEASAGASVTFEHVVVSDFGLFYYIYKGVEWVIFPPLIFLGIGAMTDFGPLIANPKSLLLGAAAQLGIFMAFIFALLLGYTPKEAASIGIIGGADGPTAIYVTSKLAPELLPAIAIAAYSYMALVPVIQPPIMKALTTKEERKIRMEQLRPVSKKEKVLFPIIVTAIVGIFLPSALPLVGMLMLGNLFKESGVVPRLVNTAANGLINTITILLGFIVGSKAYAPIFLQWKTLGIIVLGVVAFSFGTAGGVLLGKLMCKLTKGKINPLIGAAGVSAVPMAARVAQDVGRKEDPQNYLLMHAMGPNVAGVIGSTVAAGVLIAMFL
ncbi:glutaconyl-CoA decarboxylase beta subunit [Faecalibacterium sp. CAG:1138]|jgi:sodium ion-translocating decarboxylase beta subunit|nr:glutaconyl-CoA decarboxylase beta subunit [Faecalibacterium sp. CAG:1138]